MRWLSGMGGLFIGMGFWGGNRYILLFILVTFGSYHHTSNHKDRARCQNKTLAVVLFLQIAANH